MARRRIGMKALRQVIELHEQTQFSNRQIATATGVSRPVVAAYIAEIDSRYAAALAFFSFSSQHDVTPSHTPKARCNRSARVSSY